MQTPFILLSHQIAFYSPKTIHHSLLRISTLSLTRIGCCSALPFLQNNPQQKMSYNSFDYYCQLREYQLHVQRLANPETNVPSRQAFSPTRPQLDRLKDLERQQKVEQIQRQNQVIMNKLVKINRRKPEISQSVGSLRLPAIHRERQIPLYQTQNGKIAKKIIESKSSINSQRQLAGYRSVEAHKRNISKYLSQDGVIVNRKKYLAELMLLKKMRVSEALSTSRSRQQ